jgi:hypothetical protein
LVGLLATCFLILAPAALAAGKTAPKPPPAPTGFYYHVYGLIPGHHYRLALQSKTRVGFTANAIEDVLYINSGRLGSATKALSYRGTTPKTYTIAQPVKGSLQTWRLTLQVVWTRHTSVSVHLTDLSRHHS